MTPMLSQAQATAHTTSGDHVLRVAGETGAGIVGWAAGATLGLLLGAGLHYATSTCQKSWGGGENCLFSPLATGLALGLAPIGIGIGVALVSPAPWYAALLGTLPGVTLFLLGIAEVIVETNDEGVSAPFYFGTVALTIFGSVLTAEIWRAAVEPNASSARIGIPAAPGTAGLALSVAY